MIRIDNVGQTNFETIPIDPFWNTGSEKEHKMHRIHAYPAKFPSFITTKALDFAKEEQIEINTIADVFCGCGTVAFEAKRNNINFWGCDINPVATLIAKVKSRRYQPRRLQEYFEQITNRFAQLKRKISFDGTSGRLEYWYDRKHYKDLFRLKSAIEESVPSTSVYRLFFLCSFSNILKHTSRWLTKSIKPQVDPHKDAANVFIAFKDQCLSMMKANLENDVMGHSSTAIVTGNFLGASVKKPTVDMIITSPPYVTSYEYADLHQLSSLWLGFAKEYRDLRDGSVGSLHHVYDFEYELENLNAVGKKIVFQLLEQHKQKARSVV